MPDIRNLTLLHDNGRLFLQMREQYISGDIMRAYESLRIVRIDSLGSETDFEWLINDRRYAPREGDFLLFSGTDLRMPLVREKPSSVLITVLTFEPMTIFPHTELIGFFYMKNRTRHLIRAEEAAEVAKLFGRVVSELERGDQYVHTASASALLLLIVELCRTLGTDTLPSHRYSESSCELFGEIVAYISKHYTEKLTIGSVARNFNISESLLSKLLNGILGISFPNYVRRLRVNNVVRLVRFKNTGILNAAVDSGFSSVTGFYKTFREITGTSPSDFCFDHPQNTDSDDAEKCNDSVKTVKTDD